MVVLVQTESACTQGDNAYLGWAYQKAWKQYAYILIMRAPQLARAYVSVHTQG